MDVSGTSARRDLELAQRLLKEREEGHAKEIDNLREHQHEQLADAQTTYSETLKKSRNQFENQANTQREDFEKKVEESTENYQKSLQEDRKENYDKFGKLNKDYARERYQAKQIQGKQMKDLVDSQKHDNSIEFAEKEKRIHKLRTDFEKDRKDLTKHFNEKLNVQRQASADAVNDAAKQSRETLDRNTRRLQEEFQKDKQGSDLKYQQLSKQSRTEQDNLKKGFELREKQLEREKAFSSDEFGSNSEKTLKEQKDKLTDNFKRTVEDINFEKARQDQEHSTKISDQEHEHRLREASLRAQNREAENNLRHRNSADMERIRSQKELDERRHRQELFMSNETLRRNNEVSRQVEQEKNLDMLKGLESQYKGMQRDTQARAQKEVLLQEQRATNDSIEQNQESAYRLSEEGMKHAQERSRIVQQYETAQSNMDLLRAKQANDLKAHLNNELMMRDQEHHKDQYERTRDNQSKLYNAQETFRKNSDLMKIEHEAESKENKKVYDNRVKRITRSYNTAIEEQKQKFDNTTDDLRHSTLLELTRLRTDSDYDKRHNLMELQTKNRMILLNYEDKLAEMQNNHEAEMTKMREENDKTVRDTLARTKEMLDRAQSLHKYELDAKEKQITEKLKSQEAAFKEQIEKLKRSHEIALKKN